MAARDRTAKADVAKDTLTIWQQLTQAFPESDVKYRIQGYNRKKEGDHYPEGTRGQKVAYIDARLVMDRFDEVFTPARWQFQWEHVGDGAVKGVIGVLLDGEWVWKQDVGYPNNPGDGAKQEALKAAVSDALKRTAVHWGVGRFLYDLPRVWVDVDKYGREIQQQGNAQRPQTNTGGASSAGTTQTASAPTQAPQSAPSASSRPKPATVAPASTAATEAGSSPQDSAPASSQPQDSEAEIVACAACGEVIPEVIKGVNTQAGVRDVPIAEYVERMNRAYGLVLCVKDGQAEARKRKEAKAQG